MRRADITQSEMFSYRTLEQQDSCLSSVAQIADVGRWSSGDAACGLRRAVRQDGAPVDSAGAAAAGQSDPDVVLDSV